MAIDRFLPLAPAAVLLLGAFLMQVVVPHLPPRGRLFSAPLLPLLVLPILANRSFQSGRADAPTLLSGWGLDSALTLRADAFSLAFLILVVLLLFALVLAEGTAPSSASRRMALSFLLAAGASLVFVAANGLMVGYALIVFDAIGALIWLIQERATAAIFRLLLSIVTTAALTLYGLPADSTFTHLFLVLVYWLRLGLYPFLEAGILSSRKGGQQMLWFSLSTTIGAYLVMRFPLVQPVPAAILWLVVVVMFLNGLVAWLSTRREVLLGRLFLTQMLWIMLVAPVPALVAVGLTLALTTALAAMWLVPPPGRPNLGERNWPWLYATPALATLSIVGLPFTLGWMAYSQLYARLAGDGLSAMLGVITLAEGLALAALLNYWRDLLGQPETNDLASAAGLIVAAPFLVPGLSLVALQALIGQAVNTRFDWPTPVLLMVGAGWAWAALLSYGHGRWLLRLPLSERQIVGILEITWTMRPIIDGLDQAARLILRLRLVLEGEHYLGWAILIALTGIIVLLLS
ncbi:MAG: hypothetical protein ACE5H9_01460 [Anaerolineae bacterium]